MIFLPTTTAVNALSYVWWNVIAQETMVSISSKIMH